MCPDRGYNLAPPQTKLDDAVHEPTSQVTLARIYNFRLIFYINNNIGYCL